MNIAGWLLGGGGVIVGFAIKHFLVAQAAPKEHWDKETWDEFQETFMIAAALILYGGFEVMCFLSNEYAGATHTNATRMALVTIVTNLFTFKFTKSLPQRRNGV